MPFSVVHNGKVEDIHYRKSPQGEGWYTVYLGTTRLGQLVKDDSRRWAVTGYHNKVTPHLGVIEGFATRTDAMIMLLHVTGIYRSEYT